MKVTIWMRPTKASPICRYTYERISGELRAGSTIFSDCGVWKCTDFNKSHVIETPGDDLCPFCREDKRVALPASLPVVVPRSRRQVKVPLHHLNHDA